MVGPLGLGLFARRSQACRCQAPVAGPLPSLSFLSRQLGIMAGQSHPDGWTGGRAQVMALAWAPVPPWPLFARLWGWGQISQERAEWTGPSLSPAPSLAAPPLPLWPLLPPAQWVRGKAGGGGRPCQSAPLPPDAAGPVALWSSALLGPGWVGAGTRPLAQLRGPLARTTAPTRPAPSPRGSVDATASRGSPRVPARRLQGLRDEAEPGSPALIEHHCLLGQPGAGACRSEPSTKAGCPLL